MFASRFCKGWSDHCFLCHLGISSLEWVICSVKSCTETFEAVLIGCQNVLHST